jgi:hypothetical protein
MIARVLERTKYVGATMDTGPQEAGCHLSNATAVIADQHPRRDGDDFVFPGATGAFLAAVTSERVHRPGSDGGARVLEVLD